MAIWTYLFPHLDRLLHPSQSLKAPLVAEARFTYTTPKTEILTDATGDKYTKLTFTVMDNTIKLGTMSIWHNRYGAFGHFNETRKYPLG